MLALLADNYYNNLHITLSAWRKSTLSGVLFRVEASFTAVAVIMQKPPEEVPLTVRVKSKPTGDSL